MAELNLDLKHSNYAAVDAERQKAIDLYSGEATVKAKSTEYLFQNTGEATDTYDRRLKRAAFDNWCSPPVMARQALLWNKSPARDKFGPKLEALILDVDGRGTPADVFFRRITERAQVEGMTWVLVDSGRAPEGVDPATLSAADAARLRLRPTMANIPGPAVYDWDTGDDGELEWAVIAQTFEAKAGPGVAAVVTEQRVVWTRESWTVYRGERATAAANAPMKWALADEGVNALGRVPLVPFYGIKEGEFLGRSILKDVLGHTISIFNKASDRDMAEFRTNAPIPYFVCDDKPESVSALGDSAIWIKSPTAGNAQVGYLQHTGAGIESTRDSERESIKRIFEIMLQASKSDSKQVQSADSLKVENRLFNASLNGTAAAAESGELRAWQLMAAWLGESKWAGSVVYVKDFDDSQIETAMLTVFSGMAEKGQLSKETLLGVLDQNDMLPGDTTPEEELRRIEDEQNRLLGPGAAPVAPEGQPAPVTQPAAAAA
jgi:hypothetical protein